MTPITKESLEAFGMKMTDSPICPMSKTLGESELGELRLVVTRERNRDDFALMTPDSTIFIGPTCIEDLQHFEDMIIQYEPNY